MFSEKTFTIKKKNVYFNILQSRNAFILKDTFKKRKKIINLDKPLQRQTVTSIF